MVSLPYAVLDDILCLSVLKDMCSSLEEGSVTGCQRL
jgi:hypothetical protein